MPQLWLSVLGAGLLVFTMLGVVLATRHGQKREPQAGSLTELASVHGLRVHVERLEQNARQLQRERDELLRVLTQLAKLLERLP